MQGIGSPLSVRLLLLVCCLLLQACASSGGARGRPDLITREELAATPGENLLELVQRLRPRWLQSGPRLSISTPQTIAVYQDDLNLGGPDALARIPKDAVLSIRLLTAAQAGLLPGIGSQHIEHAIVVQTRREEQ